MHGPKRHGRKTRGLARDIEQFTKDGTSALQDGELNKAVEDFELAYKRSQQLGDDFAQRACAFNLGAVYIAVKQPKKGVEVLQHAIPPQNHQDGKSNGDLFYNFALGYEALENLVEAPKYFELALEEYQLEKENLKMEAEVAIKMGNLYTELGEWLSAARAYGLASRPFGMMSDYENQAVSLCHESTSLYQGQRPDLALQVADDCMILCQRLQQGDSLGRLYNELGLTYTQCRDFSKAAMCFELALPLSRAPNADKKQEAVILQNLGAVYNSLGDYQRAIGFHGAAAKLHAEFGNRNAQGQCFNNQAFAYSQVGETEAAGEAYLHALQAARDIGDSHGQWQAMEGLGAVAFNEGQFNRAVRYFKMALAVLSKSEQNANAHERIIGKLSEAIRFMATDSADFTLGDDESSYSSKDEDERVDILVNGNPRPPTRLEQRRMYELKELRKQRKAFGKRTTGNSFLPIALGVSEYESDSDLSLKKVGSRHSRARSRRSQRKVERASSESGPHQRNVQHTMSEVETTPRGNKGSRNFSRRSTSLPYDTPDNQQKSSELKRRQMRPLLRTESFDSDEERRLILKQHRGPLHSDMEVDSNFRKKPPGTRQPLEPMVYYEASSSYGNLSRAIRKLNMSRGTERPVKMEHEEFRLSASSGPLTSSLSTESELTPKGDTMTNGQTRLHLASAAQEAEIGTESDTESDTDSDISDRHSANNATGNSFPPAPPPPQSLGSTYVEPVNGQVTPAPEAEPKSHPKLTGPNYFREEDTTEDKEDRKVGNFKAIIKKTDTTEDRSTDGDGDPLYQTIRSVKSTQEGPTPGPSGEHDDVESPPLPPRPTFEAMSQEEKEAFLHEYQQKRDRNILQQEEKRGHDLEVDLPTKNKTASRACVVM